MRYLARLFLLAPLLVLSFAAAAQERPDGYPNRPIKIVVPFPAGGPSDVLARMIGQKLTEDWGQPVVVENRPGANTVLGAQQVAKAAPDGYTLLMAIDSTLTMNQYLYRTPPYDPLQRLRAGHADCQDHAASDRQRGERREIGQGPGRQGQGQPRQAQLRRRHHHDQAHRPPVQQGGGRRDAVGALQRQRRGGAGIAHQECRLHLRRPVGVACR